MSVGWEGLHGAGKQGTCAIGCRECCVQEVCVVVPYRGRLGEFLDHGLEEIVCVLE